MLAPMGIYLALSVMGCSMILMVCWFNDNRAAAAESARLHTSLLQFAAHAQVKGSHVRFAAPKVAARCTGRDWHHRGSPARTAVHQRPRRTAGLAS